MDGEPVVRLPRLSLALRPALFARCCRSWSRTLARHSHLTQDGASCLSESRIGVHPVRRCTSRDGVGGFVQAGGQAGTGRTLRAEGCFSARSSRACPLSPQAPEYWVEPPSMSLPQPAASPFSSALSRSKPVSLPQLVP